MAHAGERIHYLTLALEARSAIKRLKLLLKTKEYTPELKSALKAAAVSLRAVDSQKNLYSKLYDDVGYSRFEEIETLQEVRRMLGDTGVGAHLERVLSGVNCTDEDVRAAIRFFSAMENRALYHYNDPSLAESSG